MPQGCEKGEALEGGCSGEFTTSEGGKCSKDKEIMCFTTKPVEMFEVLNDLVIDRGPSPYVSLVELFGALPLPILWACVYHSEGYEHHMTIVQAHGLCAATPTGEENQLRSRSNPDKGKDARD
jgi:NAD+ kinase